MRRYFASQLQRRRRVAILGATGVVGQRFAQLLEGHPSMDVVALAASSKSAGKSYKDICAWKLSSTPMPQKLRDQVVRECHPQALSDAKVDFVFSALDSSVAGDIEKEFAEAGIPVFSNASNYRMGKNVPILIPDVNPDHIHAIKSQSAFKKGGFIVTNANCSTTGLVIGLVPILQKFGLEKIHVVTMQAISGAGYPGVPSLDIIDNVIPFINKEEEKLEVETLKIFGTWNANTGSFENYPNLRVSAHCNRVAVIDGHLASVSIKLKNSHGVSVEDIHRAILEYKSQVQFMKLPSAPATPIHLFDIQSQPDRPQPKLDREKGKGYTVSVGRSRICPLLDFKLTILSHNTVIGAAGGSILNAEMAMAHNYC